jgi:hypothetical protein
MKGSLHDRLLLVRYSILNYAVTFGVTVRAIIDDAAFIPSISPECCQYYTI